MKNANKQIMHTEKMIKTRIIYTANFAERALQEAGLISIKPIKLTVDNVISPFELCFDDIDYHPCSKCPCKLGYASAYNKERNKIGSCQNPYANFVTSFSDEINCDDPPDCFIYTSVYGYVIDMEEKILFLQNSKPSEKASILFRKFIKQ